MLWIELADMAEESGMEVWSFVKAGRCVLLELPSRWYLGVVEERSGLTCRLAAPALMIHSLGDAGRFLDGKPTVQGGWEATPLPGGYEVNLQSVDGCAPYDEAAFRRICKRSHAPSGEAA